jgi:hypothetical protein
VVVVVVVDTAVVVAADATVTKLSLVSYGAGLTGSFF